MVLDQNKWHQYPPLDAMMEINDILEDNKEENVATTSSDDNGSSQTS
jgi:hypothetical protein